MNNMKMLGNSFLPPDGEPRCTHCQNYAWDGGAHMVARWEAETWHHPACGKLPENASRAKEREGW